jgi:dipeptidyl aminopeptidase/acylaminoacyl peptidase
VARWFVFAVLATMFAASECTRAQERPFTVKDDIEMARFSDPYPLPSDPGSSDAKRSPDGKHFAIVMTRGLLESDMLESSILIFDTAKPKSSFASDTHELKFTHRTIATIASYPAQATIQAYPSLILDMRWCSDSSCVYFRAPDTHGTFRIYEANLGGTGARAITSAGYSVMQYDVSPERLVYRAVKADEGHICHDHASMPDSEAVTGKSLDNILFSRSRLPGFDTHTTALWTSTRRRGVYVTALVPGSAIRSGGLPSNYFSPLSISLDGRRVVELTPVSEIPKAWSAYDPVEEHLRLRPNDPGELGDDNPIRPERYTMVDLATGKMVPLIDGPNGYALGYRLPDMVVWSRDSLHLLVTDTFLPLPDEAGSARTERLRPCAVASVELHGMGVSCLTFRGANPIWDDFHVQKISFGDSDNEALLHVSQSQQGRMVQSYQYRDGCWELLKTRPIGQVPDGVASGKDVANQNIRVVVKQTLNDPPTLWAVDKRAQADEEIWEPNPQFAHLQFGNVSVYDWKDKNGRDWAGGLVKPVGYVSGRRYPLVIQIYMFYGDQFMTDGTAPTAYAARELASAGFVVLQIQKDMKPPLDEAEAQEHLEAMRSAIEYLSTDGLIDPHKVGVVGFSWTCWYVENALIKAPNLFAAATIADGIDHSYMDYHLFAVDSVWMKEQEDKITGAEPFGEGLKRWFEMSPGFHLDQIQTPLRIEAIAPISILQEWEIYSSLRMQNKPVDLIYFPAGTHIHQRPLERLASQQGNVDWFRFWLQGYEDLDPSKHSEYLRWEKLRVEQDPLAAENP